jgi:hypothetical protein
MRPVDVLNFSRESDRAPVVYLTVAVGTWDHAFDRGEPMSPRYFPV